MKTLAVANMKGGTGKSTLAVHLATGLARQPGKRVLLVDLDAQANSTAWLLGLDQPGKGKGTASVLVDGTIEDDHITHVEGRGALDLLASTPQLAGVDAVLGAEVGGHNTLKEALERREKEWDYVVIDCPPNLGHSVANALFASDGVIAPVLAAYFSLAGLRRLELTVDRIQKRLHGTTRILGYVLFAADPREAITEETRKHLEEAAPGRLFRTEIRVSTAAKSLPGRRELAWDGGEKRGAEDFTRLLVEVKGRLHGPRKAVA